MVIDVYVKEIRQIFYVLGFCFLLSDKNHVCCAQCMYAQNGTKCHEEEDNLVGDGSCELPAYCEYPLTMIISCFIVSC